MSDELTTVEVKANHGYSRTRGGHSWSPDKWIRAELTDEQLAEVEADDRLDVRLPSEIERAERERPEGKVSYDEAKAFAAEFLGDDIPGLNNLYKSAGVDYPDEDERGDRWFDPANLAAVVKAVGKKRRQDAEDDDSGDSQDAEDE